MAVSVLGEPKRVSFRILEARPRHRFLNYKKFKWTGDRILNISGWGQSLRATWPAPVITPQHYVAVAQAHIVAGDRVNAEASYNAAIHLATAELAKNPGHAREMALANISAEYATFLAGENASDASSLQPPSVSTNNPAFEAHQPSFSSDSQPFSIQAGNPAGRIVVQNCQGTINAPVHGTNNTVTVYYSPNSEARQPNAVSLDSLRNALYQYYQLSNLSIQRVSGETASLEECYINLAVVESQAQREKDKKELKKQAVSFERLPSSERQQLESTNPNKLIALEKLFEMQKLRDGSEGVPKRILIQGRAGIGKTTLCKKLVYEYHHNGLWQDRFESVLWIPLRQLKTHSPRRLEDLLCNQYFVGHESHQAQALSKVFHAHQDKTLFILDGLDEVVGELHEGRPLKDFLQTLLNQAHVVITSRPAGVDAKLLGQLDLELETVGFSPANVRAYIEKCVPTLNQAAIQQFIHHTPLIQGLVNIPIQLDALCYSWDKLPKNQEVTMAMLYEAMVDKLWRKDSVRLEKKQNGELLKPILIDSLWPQRLEKQVIHIESEYLGYLAFRGLQKEQIEFDDIFLNEVLGELDKQREREGKEPLPLPLILDLKKTSFLHTADTEQSESKRHYHFLHLTFQEFFAAKFLVRHLQTYSEATPTGSGLMLSQAQLESFIAQHKYDPRYEITWWMLAGLMNGTPLRRFFTLLEEAPRDLIGGRHQQVMMGCLQEARTRLDKKTIDGLEKELARYFRHEMELDDNKSNPSKLGCQRAFPEHLLLTCLDLFEGNQEKIYETLGARRTLSAVTISALIEKLKNENESVWASRALRQWKSLSDDAILALSAGLKDEESREHITLALFNHTLLPEETLLALVTILKYEVENNRSTVVQILQQQEMLSEKVISALITVLKDENASVRVAAVCSVLDHKVLPNNMISVLIIVSKEDENESVRVAAVRVLAQLQTLSEDIILALFTALKGENGAVREAVARTLSQQETLSDTVVSALITALKDKDEKVRTAAASALGGVSLDGRKARPENAVLALIKTLKDDDERVREAAAQALREQKTLLSDTVILTLHTALKDENEKVRKVVADVLSTRKALPENTTLALIKMLKDDNEEVREAVVGTLRQQKTLSDTAVLALNTTLKDENEKVREAAAQALREQKMLHDFGASDFSIAAKVETAIALCKREALSDNAVLAMIVALKDKNKDVRFEATRALCEQETLSDNAVLAMITALNDENVFVRLSVTHILRQQQTLPDNAILALIAVLKDESKDVRSEAAGALSEQKILSHNAVLALHTALKDENENIRSEAARVLGERKTLSDNVISDLITALENESVPVRSAAARTLGEQKTLPDNALLALTMALKDENAFVRFAVTQALGEQKMLPVDAIPALTAALKDKRAYVRAEVIKTLGKLKRLPQYTILELGKALKDENIYVRGEADRVLSKKETLPNYITGLRAKNNFPKNKDFKALGQQQTTDPFLALISALKDKNEEVRSKAFKALDLKIDQLYTVLPSLSLKQLQSLYNKFLFPYSCSRIAPLTIQNNQLHFHTAAGPKSIPLEVEQIDKLYQAFIAGQKRSELTVLGKEE
ncbi:MAG: HEAT repeat-containing protein [Glomeribacter sp. 1016415]|nr:HEAT repeat-containing protein [Glomeribacter sp. 1016415]